MKNIEQLSELDANSLYFVHERYDKNNNDNSNEKETHLILFKWDNLTEKEEYTEDDVCDISLKVANRKTIIPDGKFVRVVGNQLRITEKNSRVKEIKNNIEAIQKKLSYSELHDSKMKELKKEITDVRSFHIKVGHGNCSIILFKCDDVYQMWMVDCSIFDFTDSFNSYIDNLQYCLDYIYENYKVDSISKMFVTHPHYDHINGIKYLINHDKISTDAEFWINIKLKWLKSEYINLLNLLYSKGYTIIEPCSSNYTNEIQILYPDTGVTSSFPGGRLNNISALFLFSLGGRRMLFPGDIEETGWNRVTACTGLCDGGLDYYCISHHGSCNGHYRTRCPYRYHIYNLRDCINTSQRNILMGRDGAFPGIYFRPVIRAFNPKIIEGSEHFYEIEWGSAICINH